MKKENIKKLVVKSMKSYSSLGEIWSASKGAGESQILGRLLKHKGEIENNLDIFNEEELDFLSYFTINVENKKEKTSKEKAVEILKQHNIECKYDKEKDNVVIWNNPDSKIGLYFLKDQKLHLNISSSNQDFEEQYRFYLSVDNIIHALDKIKKIDPELVK